MKKVFIKNTNEYIEVGKIIGVGRNYAEHAIELGNEVSDKPILFLKTNSSLIFDGDFIEYPSYSNDMHHEVELVLLIGQNGKNINIDEAAAFIYAVGVGLDMTLRDVQNELKKKGHPWTLAKCFDTSTAVSDFYSNHNLQMSDTISLYVNNVLRQHVSFNKMLCRPAELISYISSVMTLERGDLIFTGTPKGVNKVESGDVLRAVYDNLTELNVRVR